MHPHSSIHAYRPLLQCTPYLHFVSFSVTSFPWHARCLLTIVSPLIKPPIPFPQVSPPPLTSQGIMSHQHCCLSVPSWQSRHSPVSLVCPTWGPFSPGTVPSIGIACRNMLAVPGTSWSQLLAFRRMLWALASILYKVLNISCWRCCGVSRFPPGCEKHRFL